MYEEAARSIIDRGHAVVRMPSSLQKAVSCIFQEGEIFFRLDDSEKVQFSTPSVLEGYMKSGSEYSLDLTRPDLCESFCTWGVNTQIENSHPWKERSSLYNAMNDARLIYEEIVSGVLRSVKSMINRNGQDIIFSKYSCLQLNFYRPIQSIRDLLQDAHEDGQLITLLHPTARGAEIAIGEQFVDVKIDDNEIFVMPGSLITAMTDGLIKPLVHRVRNHAELEIRQSLMYFVNPDLDSDIKPWIGEKQDDAKFIKQLTINNSTKFGQMSLQEMVDLGHTSLDNTNI